MTGAKYSQMIPHAIPTAIHFKYEFNSNPAHKNTMFANPRKNNGQTRSFKKERQNTSAAPAVMLINHVLLTAYTNKAIIMQQRLHLRLKAKLNFEINSDLITRNR